jgi:hypothetical protein
MTPTSIIYKCRRCGAILEGRGDTKPRQTHPRLYNILDPQSLPYECGPLEFYRPEGKTDDKAA